MVWIFNRAFFGIGRCLAHAPCIAWAANVVPLFISICKHPLPQAIPYRREIYISQGISAVLSIFLPLWMTSTGISILISGSLKKKGYWLILYCIIDWGMIGLMILSLIWQSYYLPSTLKACHRAKTWQLVENETSLFWVVGRQTLRNPLNMCDEYMLVWILNICTIIFVGQSAIYPLLRVPIPWRIVWLYGHTRSYLKSAKNIRQLLKSMRNGRLAKLGPEENPRLQQWRLTRKVTLFDIFNEDEHSRAIVSIARNLHYSDIVSLSLTSKAVNRAIFPSKARKGRSERVSMAACEDEKSECWCCGIEICKSCQEDKSLPDPTSSTHIYNCEPYCSTCYYKVLCRRYVSGPPKPEKGYYSRTPINCACRKAIPTTTAALRGVCKFCYALDQNAALGVREEREKAELKHLVKQQLRCKVCTMGLSKGGLRWWGCSLCKRECVSDVHPMWDKKKQ